MSFTETAKELHERRSNGLPYAEPIEGTPDGIAIPIDSEYFDKTGGVLNLEGPIRFDGEKFVERKFSIDVRYEDYIRLTGISPFERGNYGSDNE